MSYTRSPEHEAHLRTLMGARFGVGASGFGLAPPPVSFGLAARPASDGYREAFATLFGDPAVGAAFRGARPDAALLAHYIRHYADSIAAGLLAHAVQ